MQILLAIIALIMAAPLAAVPLDLHAQNGRLRLTQDQPPDQTWNLKGSWHFYPQRILQDIQACPEHGSSFQDLMGYWVATDLVQHPEWLGTSSFCLEIDNPERRAFSFWWPERPEVNIYGNGRLLFGSGELQSGSKKGVASRQTGLVHLPRDEKIIVLVHANNEFMRWRKIRAHLYLGDTIELSRDHNLMLLFDVFVMSSLLVTGFYQFSLFLIHRNRRETLYLGLFCLAIALRHASVGHSNALSILGPDFWGGRFFGIGHVGYFMAAAFFYQFLGISYPDLIHRWLMKSLWVVSLVFSLIVLLVGAPSFGITLVIYHVVGGTGMLSAVYVVWRAFRQKRAGSLVLALGTIGLSVTAWADMLRSQGIGLPLDVFPIGQLVFVAGASLLVSLRFSQAFDILSHLSQELSKIVPQHVISLLRAGTRLEHCMPTGQQEAVVLVFDVVGSSRVRHPDFRRSLDLCMARFFEIINDGYNPERLEAKGYRVKEMGDGMICTVGFPFKVPDGAQADAVALQLAERMCVIFHEEMGRLNTDQPIYCGIGLARGPVEGFFPGAGQKQYDLRGEPLTLATRYEAMRNQVYRLYGRRGSVIFMHDAVYQNLPEVARARFQRWETAEPGRRIRDDEEARQAWFKFVEFNKSADFSDKNTDVISEVS